MNKIHDEERMEQIESKLDKIIFILETNQQSCDKMSKHIDFVDGVYDAMKSPLNTLCNVVSKINLNPISQAKMLELPDKKNE